MGKIDRTFAEISAYASDQWCSARVGMAYDRWRRAGRTMLENEGFPSRDPLTGMTLKADVDAWLEKRRRVADPALAQERSERTGRVNLTKL